MKPHNFSKMEPLPDLHYKPQLLKNFNEAAEKLLSYFGVDGEVNCIEDMTDYNWSREGQRVWENHERYVKTYSQGDFTAFLFECERCGDVLRIFANIRRDE